MEKFLFQKKFDDRVSTPIIEQYLNKKLGITVSEFKFDVVTTDDRFMPIYTDQEPIRHLVIRNTKGLPVYVNYNKNTIHIPTNGWQLGQYDITYAAGYGKIESHELPVVVEMIDQGFTTALATELLPPNDITYAIIELDKILADRKDQRADLDSYAGDLGSTNWVNPSERYTIPMNIMGILIPHRKLTI